MSDEVNREHILEVLSAAGIVGEELEWMVASCPSLAHAIAEAQRRLDKRVEMQGVG